MGIDAIIAGGGIAGLACAWRLHAAGKEVLVLEADARAGGHVRTQRVDGYRLESGPHTFMGSADHVFALAAEVGLAGEIIPTMPAARKRYIARHGEIHAIPTGPVSFLTSKLLSFKGKLALAGEPLRTRRGDPTDTAQQFFERRFGPEAARVLAGAFISGVYAGDPARLSAPAAFPLFWRFEQESGGMIRGMVGYRKRRRAEREARGETAPVRRGLFTFREGLGQLSAGVAAKLGDRVLTGAAVQAVQRTSAGYVVRTAAGEFTSPRLVVAVPPAEAGRLLGGLDSELGLQIGGIPMAPVALVHLGYAARAREIPDGFGFLAPQGEGVRSLGVLFPSRLFEGRAPDGGDLLAGFVGGVLDPGALDLDDEALIAVVRTDLANLIGLDTPPSFARIARFPQAIPQLTLGHADRMVKVGERLGRLPGLALAGNYLRGSGMKDAVISGFEAAARIQREGR
ncbi:MAG: protoporphyrinogen oxidase [Spirochaetia bacterium]